MLIGIVGCKGSGKSTVAELVKKFRPRTKIIALADPIKRFAAEVFDFSQEQLNGESKSRDEVDDRYNVSPRKVLQGIGTDMVRNIYPDAWIELGLRRARSALEGSCAKPTGSSFSASWEMELYDTVVIPDVRFLNEMQAIVNAGGELWFKEGKQRLKDCHASERDMFLPAAHDLYWWIISHRPDLLELEKIVGDMLK